MHPGMLRRPASGTKPINKDTQVAPAVPARGNAVTRWLGRALLKIMGWRLIGELPNRPKFIIAAAPHSSNLDFFLAVGVILSLGLQCRFLAKASLFHFPLSLVMRAFGGIPVDRSAANGVVGQMTDTFRRSSKLVLGIAPEGTRKPVAKWRSGFARIAQAANVPVQPAVVDYRYKQVTFTALIEDVSDVSRIVAATQQAARSGTPRRG